MSDPAASQQAAPSSSTSSATTGTVSTDNAHLHPPFPPKGVSPTPNSPSTARQSEHPFAEDVFNAAATHTIPEYPAPNVQSPGEGEKDVSREGIDQRHLGDQHHHHQTHPLSPRQRSQRIAEEVDKDNSERPPKSDDVVRRAARKVDDEDEDSDSSQEDRDPDQQPLIRGTPLDELKTPMFERPGRGMLSRNATATAGQPGLRPAHERIDKTDVAPPAQASAGAGRIDETATAVAGKAQRPGFGAGKEMGSVSRVLYIASSRFILAPHLVSNTRIKSKCSMLEGCNPPSSCASVRLPRPPSTVSLLSIYADRMLTYVSCHLTRSHLSPTVSFTSPLHVPSSHSLLDMPIFSSIRKQIRMGASALVSALNAVPWEDDSGGDSDSSDDEAVTRGPASGRPSRPQGELVFLTHRRNSHDSFTAALVSAHHPTDGVTAK